MTIMLANLYLYLVSPPADDDHASANLYTGCIRPLILNQYKINDVFIELDLSHK